MLTLGKNAHAVLFYSFVSNAMPTKAENCPLDPVIPPTDIYLNHVEKNVCLWVQSTWGDLRQALNNTCDLLLANKQSGSYDQIACLCSAPLCQKDLCTTVYSVIVYGQNISDELANCVRDFISDFCRSKNPSLTDWLIGLGIAAGIMCCLIPVCIYMYFTCKDELTSECITIRRFNRRREEPEPLLSNQENQQPSRHLINSVTDSTLELSEQQTENNSTWCCFRR